MNWSSSSIAQSTEGAPEFGAGSSANRARARLLIVDDELAHRKVLAAIAEQSGIACKAVSSAKEALEVLRTEPMDAVISDLFMPEVSGLELLREVRLHYPHLVFLMATGMDDVRLGVQAMRQGADDYLIKPLQVD
jgi:DNA-binding NtrC family response regulator